MTDIKQPLELKPYFEYSEANEEDRKVLIEIKEIFEKITGKTIKLVFNSKSKAHYVYFDKYAKQYVITTDENHEEIDRKTALEHELSHIIFNTLMQTFSKYSQEWITASINKAKLDPKKRSTALKMLKSAYNIIEDQRIESLTGKLQEGSKNRFIKLRSYFGLKNYSVSNTIKDPVSALLASRFNRNNIVNQTEFKKVIEYIKRSEGLDSKGALWLTYKFYNKEILPFLKNLKSDPKTIPNIDNIFVSSKSEELNEEKAQSENKSTDKKENKQSENKDSKDSDSDDSKDSESDSDKDNLNNEANNKDSDIKINTNGIDLRKLSSDKQIDNMEISDTHKQNLKDLQRTKLKRMLINNNPDLTESEIKEAMDKIFEEINKRDIQAKDEDTKLKDIEEIMDQIDNKDHESFKEDRIKKIDFNSSSKKIEDALKKSEDTQTKELRKLKEQLSKLVKPANKNMKTIEAYLKKITPIKNEVQTNNYNINSSLANKLSRVFLEAKAKRLSQLKKSGSKIRINKFIQSKYSGNLKIFDKKKNETGLTVFLLVDQSGSMSGDNIQLATDLSATLFKSLEKVKDIKLKVIGYTSPINYSYGGSSVGFVRIDKLNQVGKLNNALGSTPTAEAITALSEEIKLTSGKKILCLITDGQPNSNLLRGDINNYIKYQLENLKLRNCGSFGICIGYGFEAMAKAFGHNFAQCADMNEANKTLVTIFKKSVLEFIRG